MQDQQPGSAYQQTIGDVENRPIDQPLDLKVQPIAYSVDRFATPVGGEIPFQTRQPQPIVKVAKIPAHTEPKAMVSSKSWAAPETNNQ